MVRVPFTARHLCLLCFYVPSILLSEVIEALLRCCQATARTSSAIYLTIQHIDNKTKFEEKILSTTFLFLHSLVKMLKFTYIVGYTSCKPTYIESFLTIFG